MLVLVCICVYSKYTTANELRAALFGFPVVIKGDILKILGSVEN